MKRMTSLVLSLGIGTFAPNVSLAEDMQKPFVLAITVSNSGENPVRAHVIDEGLFR